MKKNLVEFKNVAISFERLQVHRDITFNVSEQENLTILGPSGSGKTLLLKMIIALLKPSSGSIKVFGIDLTNQTEENLREIRSEIGMLFQGAALFDSLNIADNIAYGLREKKKYTEKLIQERISELLEIIALPGIQKKFPSELSGGQKKRVALARALASSPKIMLFDEPTTGLDPTATRLIDDLIIKLKREHGITSIIVTHDILSAKRISDRWILISQGSVLANGTVAELVEKDPNVIDFISGNWKGELTCN